MASHITMLWCFLLLLTLSNPVSSTTIVESLPGFKGNLPFSLETGYIGVGEEDEVQLFYYFFKSEQNPVDDPLLVWIPHGPGCSSLASILYEIGPLKFDYKASSEGRKPVLELNEYSWTKVANVLFLDSPVGTGFSYSTASQGYNTSDTKTVSNIYEFIRKWLVSHPRYLSNQLIISGESYAGIIGPAVIEAIFNGQEAGNHPDINLIGYVLGNPFTDVDYDVNSRVKYAHRVALLSDELYEDAKTDCGGEYVHVNASNSGCVENLEIIKLCLADINPPMILENKCAPISTKPHNPKWGLSPLGLNFSDCLFSEANPIITETRYCRNYNYLFVNIWANDLEVQEALGVKNGTISNWEMCRKNLTYTFDIPSGLKYHQRFSGKKLRVLIYSGDHDLIIPYVGTEAWIQTLNLTVSSDDEWRPWFVDGQIAGYTEIHWRNEYVLTFVTLKGAGHTAPEYKPQQSFEMIGRWLACYFL